MGTEHDYVFDKIYKQWVEDNLAASQHSTQKRQASAGKRLSAWIHLLLLLIGRDK